MDGEASDATIQRTTPSGDRRTRWYDATPHGYRKLLVFGATRRQDEHGRSTDALDEATRRGGHEQTEEEQREKDARDRRLRPEGGPVSQERY